MALEGIPEPNPPQPSAEALAESEGFEVTESPAFVLARGDSPGGCRKRSGPCQQFVTRTSGPRPSGGNPLRGFRPILQVSHAVRAPARRLADLEPPSAPLRSDGAAGASPQAAGAAGDAEGIPLPNPPQPSAEALAESEGFEVTELPAFTV